MKINGIDCMYRSFDGYNVELKVIDTETYEVSDDKVYIDGKFNGKKDIETFAIEHYALPNKKAIKAISVEHVEYKVAMRTAAFIEQGFLIDDNFKPINGMK